MNCIVCAESRVALRRVARDAAYTERMGKKPDLSEIPVIKGKMAECAAKGHCEVSYRNGGEATAQQRRRVVLG